MTDSSSVHAHFPDTMLSERTDQCVLPSLLAQWSSSSNWRRPHTKPT